MNAETKTIVMLERHLHAELELIDELEKLNQLMSSQLQDSGIRGLSLEYSNALSVAATNLERSAGLLRQKRNSILSTINSRSSEMKLSIRQFIKTLDSQSAGRLEELRQKLLDRLTEIHASMLGNQAVLYYSHEFYRRLVNGFLNIEPGKQQYRGDGQKPNAQTGNLVKRAC